MRTLLLAAVAVVLACVLVSRAQAGGIVIYLNNTSTEISQTQLDNLLPAYQHALDDFAASWHVSATVVDRNPRPGDWVVNLTDAPAPCTPGGCALGYHWRTQTVVYAEVFVAEILFDGYSVSQTLTHEAEEMLADPYGDRAAQTRGGFALVEVCDPVSDWFYWTAAADGTPVEVADFVTPAWFSGGHGPYDRNGKLRHAGQLAPGGYTARWSPDGWISTFN